MLIEKREQIVGEASLFLFKKFPGYKWTRADLCFDELHRSETDMCGEIECEYGVFRYKIDTHLKQAVYAVGFANPIAMEELAVTDPDELKACNISSNGLRQMILEWTHALPFSFSEWLYNAEKFRQSFSDSKDFRSGYRGYLTYPLKCTERRKNQIAKTNHDRLLAAQNLFADKVFPWLSKTLLGPGPLLALANQARMLGDLRIQRELEARGWVLGPSEELFITHPRLTPLLHSIALALSRKSPIHVGHGRNYSFGGVIRAFGYKESGEYLTWGTNSL